MTTTSSTSGSGSGLLSSLGIGSGLNVASIIDSLVTASSAPLTSLQRTNSGYRTQISEYGQISAAYSQLQGAIKGLQDPSAQNVLFGLSTSSSTSTVASGSITGPATIGSYALNVSSLAKGQQIIATGGKPSSSEAITTSAANISIQLGAITGGTKLGPAGGPNTYSGSTYNPNGPPVVVSIKAGASLSDIRDAINSSNTGVSATLINDGTNYRLALSANGPGANASINITSSGDAALSTLIDQDPSGSQNFQETQAASDLSATLNGIAITGSSNTLEKTVSGLTINVESTGTSTISVNQSASQAASAMSAFVSAWNGLNGLIKSLTSYDASTKTAGPLLGDPLAGQAFFSLTNATFGTSSSESASGSPVYNTLASIGLTIDSKGVTTIDSTRLAAALKANPNSLANLFSTSKGNILKSSQDAVTNLLGKNGIAGKNDSLNQQITGNQKQQDSWNLRLTQIRANLTAQYTAMDSAVAKFQTTSSFLNNQIAQFNKSNN